MPQGRLQEVSGCLRAVRSCEVYFMATAATLLVAPHVASVRDFAAHSAETSFQRARVAGVSCVRDAFMGLVVLAKGRSATHANQSSARHAKAAWRVKRAW